MDWESDLIDWSAEDYALPDIDPEAPTSAEDAWLDDGVDEYLNDEPLPAINPFDGSMFDYE